MAVAYTTEEKIEAANVGSMRLDVLLDRNKDGTPDEGVLDAVVLDAGTYIDSRLAQRYAVPFAAVPATPDMINLIARELVLWELYDFLEPEGPDAQRHFKKADGLLTGLLDGTFDIPGAARAPAGSARPVVVYSAGKPVFSGRTKAGGYRGRGF